MWHVDEGALHAYLDGALDEYPAAEARRVREHVETCAACADRLADERRLREQAQEILALAAPQVDVPTFEELRAYVRRSQPTTSRLSVRLYRMGWAASVVLALGTGWILRGQRTEPTLTAGSEITRDALRQRAAEAGAAPVADLGAPSTPSQAAESEALAVQAQDAEAARALSGPVALADAGARTEAALARNEAAAGGASGAAAGSVAFRDAPADRVAVPPPSAPASSAPAPEVDAPELAEVATTSGPQAAGAQAAGAQPAAPAPQTQARGTDAALRAVPPDQRLTSASTLDPTLGGAALARTAGTGAPNGAADDEVPSLVVPGLEVVDVLPVGEGTTFAGMRALQLLQSGDTLEIVHLPESVSPASLPPVRDGWSELVRQRGEGWIVMRARAPETTLLELLQRLEDGR